MAAPPCAPGCGCGKHHRAALTRADLDVLARVFGFASIEEFDTFLARQDELLVRDARGRYREQVI